MVQLHRSALELSLFGLLSRWRRRCAPRRQEKQAANLDSSVAGWAFLIVNHGRETCAHAFCPWKNKNDCYSVPFGATDPSLWFAAGGAPSFWFHGALSLLVAIRKGYRRK